MKIRAIRVAEVGGFAAPVAVEGFSGGLDILVGPNELGKSTLLAALEAALLVKHATRGRPGPLERIVPDRGGAPLVEVDLDVAGKLWRLRKRFVASPTASLVDLASGAVVARGEEASRRAAALLGGREGETRREQLPVGLLWVEQAESFEPPVAREGALVALEEVIDAEVRTLDGGGHARLIAAAARRRLAELITDERRRPRKGGPLAEALARRDALASALGELERAGTLERERRLRMQALEAERRTLASPEATRALAEVIDKAEAALVTADRAREELRVLAERAATAEAAVQAAAGALAAEEKRRAERARARAAKAAAEAALAALGDEWAAAATAVEAARAEAARAEAHQREAERAWQATLEQMASAQRRRERRELVDRHREASRLAVAIDDADRRLQRLPTVTPERLSVLLASEREIAALEAVRASRIAAAPVLTVAYARDPAGRLRLGARTLVQGERVPVAPRLDVDIDGVGRITIESGVDFDDLEADLTAHRETLAAALAAIGVADVAAAADVRREREQAETTREDAGAALAKLAPEGLAKLGATLEALDFDLSGAEGSAADSLEGLPADPVRAEVHLTTARQAMASARTSVDECDRRLADLQRARDGELARIEALEARIRALTAGDPAAAILAAGTPGAGTTEGGVTDPVAEADTLAALRARVAEAQAALAEVHGARAPWLAAMPDAATRAALEAQSREARRAQAHRDEERTRLGREIERIVGALEAAGERGRRRSEAEVREALAAAERRVAELEEDVAALVLLLEVLSSVEAGRQQRLRAPLQRRLAPYLAMLLPGAELDLSTSLAIDGYRREGRPQRLERASKGTREQIAVLVRLAYARLLAERGSDLPVLLDDALVFSDDDRLARMFAILEEASRHHQVIVATCHERGFAGLDGNRLLIRPWQVSDEGGQP
jgi:hypothetical protein